MKIRLNNNPGKFGSNLGKQKTCDFNKNLHRKIHLNFKVGKKIPRKYFR